MTKVRVHFADSFRGMVHDAYPFYKNTVPFCEYGLATWCDAVPIDKAEFVHVGQVREVEIKPLEIPDAGGKPVVVDIEGDYTPETFRQDIIGCVRVCCGGPLEWRRKCVFPRPTMSRFLVHAARNLFEHIPEPSSHILGFIGKADSHGVRKKMARAAVGLSAAICLQNEWHGPSELNHPARASFAHSMLGCSVALCPQGEGVATSRFYEACFFGRFPLVIGETLLLGDGYTDLSFVKQIDAGLSEADMRKELEAAADMPIEEARDRGRAARDYFDTIVRRYFADPTRMFLDWLNGSFDTAP